MKLNMFTVCYDPPLASKTKRLIEEGLSSSMVSEDSSSGQFEIGTVRSYLNKDEIGDDDWDLLKRIENDGASYIELC